MNIRSVWWPRLAALILVALAVYAVVGRALAPKEVSVVEITEGPADQVLAVVGRVRPLNLVSVQSESAGAIVALLHDEGDQVRKGDLLARIRSDQEAAAVAVSDAQLRALDAQLILARQKRARVSKLATEGWATRVALDESEAAVAAAAANRDAAIATARQSRARSQEFDVRAPMGGAILTRPVDPGQVIGLSTILFEMGTTGQVEIEAEVDEYLADRVPINAAVMLSPSGTALRLPGRISQVSPQVDASTGGRLMRFVANAAAADLRPGRSVDVVITVARRANALSVPRSALLNNRGQAEVKVVENGRVVSRAVTTLDWPGTHLIVTSGLKRGDQVMAEPSAATPGTRVKAKPAPDAQAAGKSR